MPALVTYAAPATEPVTLTEAKAQCSVDGSDHDAMLTWLIAAARQAAESATSQAMFTQTLDLTIDAFPCGDIILPRSPLQSVTAITYIDSSGATQTLAADQYQVDAASQPPRIAPAYGLVWPTTRTQLNAVKVRFVAGYTSAALVPADLKAWMLLFIAAMFENRASISVGAPVVDIPYVDQLVAANRIYNFVSY